MKLLMIVETSVFFLFLLRLWVPVARVLIGPNCLRPGVQWIQLVTDNNVDELREGPLKQVVAVTREKGE